MATPVFRVEQEVGDNILVHPPNVERSIEVRRTLVHLKIVSRALRVCQSLLPNGLERWLTLDAVELSIGSEGDKSDLSVWPDGADDRYDAENKIFGVDGDSLQDLEITHARVVSLEARDRDGHPYLNRSAESDESDDEAKDQEASADLWYHTGEDDSGYRWSALVLTVGLPEPQFQTLIDACESGRADSLVLEYSCRANSTGWAFQSARDLILSPGETVRLQVDGATLSAPAIRASTNSTEEHPSKTEISSGDDEWDRERDGKLPESAVSVGHGISLLVATVGISLLAALFGASATAVLVIAIVGGTAALITTLRSIGGALIERVGQLSMDARPEAFKKGP